MCIELHKSFERQDPNPSTLRACVNQVTLQVQKIFWGIVCMRTKNVRDVLSLMRLKRSRIFLFSGGMSTYSFSLHCTRGKLSRKYFGLFYLNKKVNMDFRPYFFD
jgi:hypothetical protein